MSKNNLLLDKALESTGGRAEFLRKHRQLEKSLTFIESNKDELLKHYDENWIAVHDAKVVSYGKDPNKVLKEVSKRNLPDNEVITVFISSRKAITLF